jgi:hypothetical protein
MAFDLGNGPAARHDAHRRFRPTDPAGDIPASPPPGVLAAVDAAFVRAGQLRAAGREVHFAVDPERGLVIQERTLGGEVLRTLRPSAALDLICGDLP